MGPVTRKTEPWLPGTPCWADLATPDPEHARAFYGAVLGWEFELGGPEPEAYAFGTVRGARAAGMIGMRTPELAASWTLYFATADATVTAAAVTAAGGQVHVGPARVSERGTMLAFTDPAGAFCGAWQPATFDGAAIVDEPGAMVWRDLRTPDPDGSREFLTAAFGVVHDELDDGPPDYTTFRLDGTGPVAGVGPLGGVGPMWGPPDHPHWLVYFGVADLDGAVGAALELGGVLALPLDTTPFGRLATLIDPAGAAFALVQTPAAS